jgi:predicted Zn-dependent peptidase
LKFRSHRLPNGLEIVAECNDEAHSTGLGFFVRTGSRDESDEVAGVSHFLEHMVFKGTPVRSAEDVNRDFDEMGAQYNAFTSEENTVYYAAVLPESQAPCVDLLADIMRPSLRTDDFNMEKQVIIEEIRMYDDQPPYGADERIRALFFGQHPLSRSVLGTEESITDLTPEQMRVYFESRYSPGNMILAASGRVDFEALIEQVATCCGDWQPAAAPRDIARAKPLPGFDVVHRENSNQEYIVQLAAGPSATDNDRFAAKLLSTMLGDDCGSRLYWELVEPGLAEHASLMHWEYDGSGVFMSSLSGAPEEAESMLETVHKIYREAEKSGFTADELAQAKSKLNSRVVLSSERPRSRLFSVGGNWLQRGEYRSVKDDLVAVDQVTLDEVHAVLAKYPLSDCTTAAVGPLKNLRPPK